VQSRRRRVLTTSIFWPTLSCTSIMRLIIDIAGCMLNGHGVKEASYYESRMSVLEGSAWHSPVDLPIHPVASL
jgi:hypothetical protein